MEWIRCGSSLLLLAQCYGPQFYVSIENPREREVGEQSRLTASGVISCFQLYLISSLTPLPISDLSYPILINFSSMLFLWKKTSLCYWCFIIFLNFHTTMKNSCPYLILFENIESIVTVTLVTKYSLYFFVFISSFSTVVYWAI